MDDPTSLPGRESPSSAAFGPGGFGLTVGSVTVRCRSIGSRLAAGFWDSSFTFSDAGTLVDAEPFGSNCQSDVSLVVAVFLFYVKFVDLTVIASWPLIFASRGKSPELNRSTPPSMFFAKEM